MNIKYNKKSRDSVEKIKNSICKLLNEVGHDRLSIKGICLHAGINRTTFYAHFDSLESALYHICEEYVIKAYQIFIDTNYSYRDRIIKAIGIIGDRRDFFAYVFNNVCNLELEIMRMIESYHVQYASNSKDYKYRFSLAFVISGFVGVGRAYFNLIDNDNCPLLTAEQFADVFCNTINLSNPYFPIL